MLIKVKCSPSLFVLPHLEEYDCTDKIKFSGLVVVLLLTFPSAAAPYFYFDCKENTRKSSLSGFLNFTNFLPS